MNEIIFKEVLSEIIDDFMPEEKLSFDLGGEEVIHQVFETGTVKASEIKGDINFLEQAKTVLEFVGLIISTYKSIKELYTLYKAKKDSKWLAIAWKELMIEEGISEEKAIDISNKYSNKLLERAQSK